MPLSAIDPQTALVVIDLQNGIVNRPQEPSDLPRFADVVERSKALADAFRAHGLPVVLVNVAGAPAGRTDTPRRLPGDVPADFFAIADGLNTSPDDVIVTKRSIGAFATTDLDAILRDRGVSQIVFTGIATSIGVESTARYAYDLGYNVTFAIDAMSDLTPASHVHTTTTIFPRLGEVASTEDVLASLSERA